MCTLIALHQCVVGAPLVIAANRDEFLDRPAEGPALRDTSHGTILAPKDARAGGTWLGMNPSGLFAAVTNRRNGEPDPELRSRGLLVHDVLGAATAEKAVPIHWGLVLVALFTFSVAGVRVRNPFHTPRAPTAAEARPIVAMLLTDTYLAFNLDDENAAFDRLARNLSEDLVPDVYLDSRRRLTAGTRKGAEVTVKDVSVMSVEAPSALDSGDGSVTYPCKWVVTARVKHWQHIHDRQNVYLGKLAIRVENDRWKISDLELLSEEREIVSWGKS